MAARRVLASQRPPAVCLLRATVRGLYPEDMALVEEFPLGSVREPERPGRPVSRRPRRVRTQCALRAAGGIRPQGEKLSREALEFVAASVGRTSRAP